MEWEEPVGKTGEGGQGRERGSREREKGYSMNAQASRILVTSAT